MSTVEDIGGRPRRLGEAMNEEDARRALTVLRVYLEQNHMAYEQISRQLAEWYAINEQSIDAFAPFTKEEVAFKVSRSAVARAVSNDIIPEPSSMKLLFLWIMSIELCNVDYQRKLFEDNLISKDGIILSVRRAFGMYSDMRAIRIEPWVGEYALYRPFHLDPRRQAQVNQLKIGSEKSDFDCSLVSSFPGMFGEPQENIGTGKLTPLDDTHAVAMLALNLEFIGGFASSKPPAGQYTLHLSDPVKSKNIDGFRGVMVASEGPNPSAWPIYAVRTKDGEAIEPHVLSRAEYKALPIIVRQQLDRGSVYWRDEDFPKALSRGYAKG